MIKVETEDLKNELGKLNEALDVFSQYSSSFIDETIEAFGGMNSDFTDKMEETLDNMRDTKAEKLYNNLSSYAKSLETLIKDFEEIDNSISIQLEGE